MPHPDHKHRYHPGVSDRDIPIIASHQGRPSSHCTCLWLSMSTHSGETWQAVAHLCKKRLCLLPLGRCLSMPVPENAGRSPLPGAPLWSAHRGADCELPHSRHRLLFVSLCFHNLLNHCYRNNCTDHKSYALFVSSPLERNHHQAWDHELFNCPRSWDVWCPAVSQCGAVE